MSNSNSNPNVDAIIHSMTNIGSHALTELVNKYAKPTPLRESWFDFWNTYYKFDEIWTNSIDMMLVTYGAAIIDDTLIDQANRRLPAVGSENKVYYIFPNNCRNRTDYITFIKKKENIDNRESIYYVCAVSMNQGKTFEQALVEINKQSLDKIRVLSIDTSSCTPCLFQSEKPHMKQKPHQKIAIRKIIRAYIESPIKNAKVMIFGHRGTSKSYTGILLKRKLEKYYDKYHNLQPLIQVVDNFNPSWIGINIRTMILSKARPDTPMIVIIDEIDKAYEKAVSDAVNYDPRLSHTASKQEFNNMLDSIGTTENLIIIYTTEKNPLELSRIHGDYKSFMRKGRIDFFLHFTHDSCTKYENDRNGFVKGKFNENLYLLEGEE